MNADRIAEVYYGTHGNAEQQRRARQRIHWMCAAVRGRDVLDVGCSQGIASILLGREAKQVVGIDREQSALQYADRLLQQEEEPVRERVSFQAAEAVQLPFEPDSFDTILLGEVLEHQVDPGPVLQETERCLRSDGVLVITTPYGVFPYHDHKEPVYLVPLLERLGEWFTITDVELLDTYLALVATHPGDGEPRFDALAALRVAESRLRHQDEAVWSQRNSMTKLRQTSQVLEHENEELRARAAERDRLEQELRDVQRELQELRAHAIDRDRLARELADSRATAAELEAVKRELDSAQGTAREGRAMAEALEAELRRSSERVAELEAASSERDAKSDALRAELDGLRQELRSREAGLEAQAEQLRRASARSEATLEEADELRAHRNQLIAALERRSAEATQRMNELDEATAKAEVAAIEAAELRERVTDLEEREIRLSETVREHEERIMRADATESRLAAHAEIRDADLAVVARREREHLRTIQRLRSETIQLEARSFQPATATPPDPGAGNGVPFPPAEALEEAPPTPAPPAVVPEPSEAQPSVAHAIAATEERPGDVAAWRRLAEANLREKHREAAADAALKALDLDPRSRTSIWLAAKTLAPLAPDTRFGDVMDRLAPINTLDDDALVRARDLAVEAGDHLRVLVLFDEARKRGAAGPGWIAKAAFAHWELADEAAAQELVEPLLAEGASDSELKAAAGYLLRLNNVEGAKGVLARMTSPPWAAMVDAGRRLARSGMLKEALATYDEVLALDPSNPVATGARNLAAASLAVAEDRWARPVERVALPRTSARVLHFLQRTFPHHLAGSTVRTHAIGRAQREVGLDVHMVTQPHFPWNTGLVEAAELDVLDGVHYHRLRDPEGGRKRLPDEELRKYAELAAPLVQELQPAVLHPASTYVNALVALELGERFDIPVVYEVRGFPEERIIAPRHTRLRIDTYEVRRRLERRCWERAAHITTLAEVMKRHMVEHGIPPGKITVVPNAIDPKAWTPMPPDRTLASKLGLPEETTVVGYISTFAPYDGIEYLLRAVRILRDAGTDVHCLLVGGGQERRFLEQTSSRIGVDEHVTFAGVVPHDQVKRYYELIDIFVVPRTNEPVSNLVTPLKPYEAMAMRRAVVVSGTTALKEMVDDGRTGLCFEPENAESLAERIQLLVDDPSYRKKLADTGRAWVMENRTWRGNAHLYERVYESLGAL